ncbi:NAD/FAD-binding protein [Trinickia dabaoshanensis]|uniref:NAD/FAD-binding protein n=1 Tax=Trinickia dabaoshanensis TaxID=564714 RepID=A0A2N7VBE0_9BURK|nr:FAD-dependent oxidoreductase [Trinickia dabaoshanensis]PMS14478.1 NAD/FAD-binding protein [Trinickia dabaoshanensis]
MIEIASAPRFGSKVAVIGAGISGLAAGWLLSRRHDVTLFEAGERLGGHTNTVDVEMDGVTHPVDTGFLVFNERTYPNLIGLFDELKVDSHASDMSFSVSLDGGRLEWAGTNLNTVFAQRRNALSPSFLGMLRDIIRFNGMADQYLAQASQTGCCVGDLLDAGRFGDPFRNHYLLPMAAAIWSCATADVLRFPATTFLRFCINHALLQINQRPRWRTVRGGGREYVRRLAAAISCVRADARVERIRRVAGGVDISVAGETVRFDQVVIATHAPTSLKMLEDADAKERSLLGAVRFQSNVAILHTDEALLPRRQRVWSAWNYLARRNEAGTAPVCVSYLLNRLQPLPFKKAVIVTLNAHCEPRPDRQLGRFTYDHPLLDHAAVSAQYRLSEIQGVRNTWFAGAWTGYGFHEDGLKSALRVAAAFGVRPDWAQI